MQYSPLLSDAADGGPSHSRRVHRRKQTPQDGARDQDRVLVRGGK
jgi:hypothetical protein